MKNMIMRVMRQDMISVIIAIMILCIVLSISAKGFSSPTNIESILKVSSITIVVGLAQLSVLAVGQFNLALGSIGCFSAMLSMALIQELGVPLLPALIAGVLLGAALGWVQGLLVARSGINPFVVTLALSTIYLGAATVIFQSQVFNDIPKSFGSINRISLLGIPLMLIIALAFVLLLFLVMNRSYIGRQLLATGESSSAANIAGIRTKSKILIAHVLSGVLAAFAGLLSVPRLGSAQLSLGSDWMLLSFAAPVLGGTLLSGGKVAVIGTIFGAILLNMINSGLVLLDVSFYWTQTFLGVILVFAFAIDRIRHRVILREG